MPTRQEIETSLGITGFNWNILGRAITPAQEANLLDALYVNRMSLKSIVNAQTLPLRKNQFRDILLGLKNRQLFVLERLPRLIFLRTLFRIDILQIPTMNAPAIDPEWVEFTRCLATRSRHHQRIFHQLGAVYNWLPNGNARQNQRSLTEFKKAFNNVAVIDLPIAFDIFAYFANRPIGGPPLTNFVTELRMPDWVRIWKKSPPGKKPIDVSFNEDKLKPHFEKHVCHRTTDIAHPAEECIAWMEVLKYDHRITLDYLKTFLIRPTPTHIAIMFPDNAPTTQSSIPLPDTQLGHNQTNSVGVKSLATTPEARLCFIENYLSQSQRLVDSLWRDFGSRYERIARDTLNACKDGFLYFETNTQKIFFVGSTSANVGKYQFFVMARFDTDTNYTWEFSTLYMPKQENNTSRLAEFRASGHLWDGSIQ
ncbi:hypothetical protein [Aliikangiella sp. IMCC44359]|uniref:hypothetical protein n=1 Tax=Aliikangiella sp. IMCC44359 TaxID=3459125 RepID=UPI00403B248A